MHMAIGAVVNAAVGPGGQARGQAAVAAARRRRPRSGSSPRSTSATSPTRSPRRRRWTSCARGRPGAAERTALLRERGYPGYTTSPGWLGYSDEKLTRLARAGRRRRLHPDQAEGRRGPRRRHPPLPDRPRGRRPGHPDGDRRQPALGRRRGGALDARARRVRPVLGRGAHQPRRRPRARRDPRGRRPGQGRHRRARAEPHRVQAAPAGRRPRRPPDRRGPRRRASTRTSRSCCWPPSSACRSARTRAASACANSSSTCRCSTTWRSSGTTQDRVIEYVDHLHEHFLDPVRAARGPLHGPHRAGLLGRRCGPSPSPRTPSRAARSGPPTSPYNDRSTDLARTREQPHERLRRGSTPWSPAAPPASAGPPPSSSPPAAPRSPCSTATRAVVDKPLHAVPRRRHRRRVRAGGGGGGRRRPRRARHPGQQRRHRRAGHRRGQRRRRVAPRCSTSTSSGIVRATRAALPHLRGSSHAAIVNTCSIAATAGLPQRALYCGVEGRGALPHPRHGRRPRRRGDPRQLRQPRHRRHPVGRPAAGRRARPGGRTRRAGRPPAHRTAGHGGRSRGRHRLPGRARSPAPRPAPRSRWTAACRACGCAPRAS